MEFEPTTTEIKQFTLYKLIKNLRNSGIAWRKNTTTTNVTHIVAFINSCLSLMLYCNEKKRK